ncbi:hypothetical protein [Kosakonia radicincitans]|uniref:hypothetical protein n=1 Tax=Kosakonia radicincitans TaxID=283686 RepID=UPI0023684A81|nr:hypothetical protein [Kosakonia radicincitans]MDD7995522.1 hypothetical protein [Kosakonia radicincitans]
MRILGLNIKSNIFNDSDWILHKWDKVYRRTTAMQHVTRPAKEAFKDKLALIHTLRYVDDNNSPFLSGRAEDIFATWDVISSSLIRLQSSLYDRNQWADVGLILAAPAQNIIGTFHKDVWFPNHAGNTETERRNSYALAESYFKGLGKTNNPGVHRYLKTVMPERTYANMYDPESLIWKSDCKTHNEVLIVGKKDVNTYAGYPPTDRIKVCAIYFQYNAGLKSALPQFRKNKELIDKLKSYNPDLPVIEHSVWGGSVSNFHW